MKKLLIGLLMLGSISALANDYTIYKTSCKISSEEASISDPRPKPHKNKITFQVTATGLNESRKILKESLDSSNIGLVESLVSDIYLDKVFCLDCDRDVVGKKHIGFKLSIDREAAQKILENNSGELITTLPQGIKETKIFPRIKTDWSWNNRIGQYEFETEKRFQIHFEPNELDGLSYHIIFSCTQKQKH